MAEASHSTHLQLLLDQLKAGRDDARERLVENSINRFRRLTRRMFPRSSALRRLDETDDVLQKAMVRLHLALVQHRPDDVRAYVGLAARQLRWVLYDLARKVASSPVIESLDLHGPEHEQVEPVDIEGEPSTLAEWTEFHDAIGRLPDEVREMFDLLLYEGMSKPEAAVVLGTSLTTLKRRWIEARLLLEVALRGEWPTLTE